MFEREWDNDLLVHCGREIIRREMEEHPGIWITEPEEWTIQDLNYHGITLQVMAALDAYHDYLGKK